jgi:hypothetical protein
MGRSRTRNWIRLALGAVALAGLIDLAACVNPPHPPDADTTSVPSTIGSGPERPEVLTDLSNLSASNTVALPAAIQLREPESGAAHGKAPSRNETVTQRLAAEAPVTVYSQETASSAPHGTRLLNDKARKYAEFSDILLTQTLKAVQQLEAEKLSQRRVRDDLNPVVLTAVMDSQGRLNEIAIEQHSGDLAIDHLFIDACKKGIWSRNPPIAARGSDNDYRVRIQGVIYNSSFDRYGQYTYDTELGLGLL